MGKISKSADKRQYTIVALSIALIILTIVPSVSAATNIGITSTGTTTYPNAKTITPINSVAVDTGASKFGAGSAKFTKVTGQLIQISDPTSFAFGSNSFTIEMWVNIASTGQAMDLYTKRLDYKTQISVTLIINTNGYLQLVANFDKSSGTWAFNQVATAKTVPLGTWTHIALVRNGGTFTVYQDGTAVITITGYTGALSDDGSYAQIGGVKDAWPVDGRIDEVRISNIARYTSNFTPQTSRFDHDANTLVLMHLDGTSGSTFIDDVITGQATATKISILSDNTPVSSISFYSHASGNFRVAIYSDNSGPNTKLWESPNTAAVTGWNTITTAAGTPSSLTLNTGTYWLVWQWNSANSGPSYTGGVNGDGKYLPMAYGSFPATWTGGTTSSHKWSIYLTVGGLVVTPENGLGAVVALAACFGGCVAFVGYKKKAKN